ncbi:hypothetical protein ABE26_22610 [Cytobacillus firmus]|nr:hypothetical protein [Cytobacillus firmus]
MPGAEINGQNTKNNKLSKKVFFKRPGAHFCSWFLLHADCLSYIFSKHFKIFIFPNLFTSYLMNNFIK